MRTFWSFVSSNASQFVVRGVNLVVVVHERFER